MSERFISSNTDLEENISKRRGTPSPTSFYRRLLVPGKRIRLESNQSSNFEQDNSKRPASLKI